MTRMLGERANAGKAGVIRFLSRALVMSTPMLGLLASYVALDPFRVLHHRTNCYDPPTAVVLDRDWASTEAFVGGLSRERYDTIVFGNSRTVAYRAEDLESVLGRDIRPFHFDAADESLYGVHAKARFIHERGVPLRHALIVLDAGLLSRTTNDHDLLRAKHPLLSGESWVSFQLVFLRGYFSDSFAPVYLHYRLIGHTLPYMGGKLDLRGVEVSMPANEMRLTTLDDEIARDGAHAYATRHAAVFPPRSPRTREPVVDETADRMLRETADWLHASGARVEVVVSPLYDQVRLADADRGALEAAFGAHDVHDFSGVNELTSDVSNYYESSHYRPPIGAEILRRIYGGSSTEHP
jgi:hypothetical protein